MITITATTFLITIAVAIISSQPLIESDPLEGSDYSPNKYPAILIKVEMEPISVIFYTCLIHLSLLVEYYHCFY